MFDRESHFAQRQLIDYQPGRHPGDFAAIGLHIPFLQPGLEQFLAEPWRNSIEAVSLGMVLDPEEGGGVPEYHGPMKILIGRARFLPALRHLFVGNVGQDESEVSWITQTDYGPVLAAFPDLETLHIRGSMGLRFPAVAHARLKTLIVETGGLPGAVTRGIAAADLPALEHLELWLGHDGYGCDTTVEDLRPILAGTRLPRLRRLGLPNAGDPRIAEAIALAVSDSPLLDRLAELDLRGTALDRVVKALTRSPGAAKLARILLGHGHDTVPPAVPALPNLVWEPFVMVGE